MAPILNLLSQIQYMYVCSYEFPGLQILNFISFSVLDFEYCCWWWLLHLSSNFYSSGFPKHTLALLCSKYLTLRKTLWNVLVFKFWYFLDFQPRNDQKRATVCLPKMYPGFPKLCPGFPKMYPGVPKMYPDFLKMYQRRALHRIPNSFSSYKLQNE